MPQLEYIDAIERRLWSAADTLRANSSYASNEYFLPVMGLVFLRHAFSRYLAVRDEITAGLPTRGGKRRAPTPQDFSRKGAMLLRPGARFDRLVALPGGEDRAKAIIEAMESIEADYESLRGALPKDEYRELDNDVLGQLLRTLDPDALKRVTGDVFGRIYEYSRLLHKRATNIVKRRRSVLREPAGVLFRAFRCCSWRGPICRRGESCARRVG